MQNTDIQIDNLVRYFLQKTYSQQGNLNAKYEKNYQLVTKYLSNGWTIKELYYELEKFEMYNPNRMQYLFTFEAFIPEGLHKRNLVLDIIGYHNDLREQVQPVSIKFLEDGTMIREAPNNSFNMKEYYTIDNALQYYYKLTKQQPSNITVKRDEGKLNYLLKEFDIDEILFAIDITNEDKKASGSKLYDLFDIQKNIERAKKGIKRKRNQMRLFDINKKME